MSDYAKIDDVFSIPEEEHGLDRPAADEIFTRTIEIFATPVPINTNSNGDQDAVHDGSEEPIDHSQWGIENVLGDFTEQLKQAEGEGTAAEQTSSPGTDPHYFPNGIPNPEPMRNDTHKDEAGDHPEDFSDIQTMLAQAEQTDPHSRATMARLLKPPKEPFTYGWFQRKPPSSTLFSKTRNIEAETAP